jgi:hypothetical protein
MRGGVRKPRGEMGGEQGWEEAMGSEQRVLHECRNLDPSPLRKESFRHLE